MSASVDEVAKEQLRTEIREETLNDWSPMEEQLRAEIREEVWRERSSMENRLRAQVREEVEDMFQIKVIDALVLEHQHAINTLLYGVTPAQDKSTADTLVCREKKANLAKVSETSTSDKPVYWPPGHPFFNIEESAPADAQSSNAQIKSTEERTVDDPTTKEGSKAHVDEVSSRGNNKDEKEREAILSLQDRVIAAAKERLRGLGDPRQAYAQGS